MKVHKENWLGDDTYCQTYDATWMIESIDHHRKFYNSRSDWWEVKLHSELDFFYDLSVFVGSQGKGGHWRDVTDEEFEVLIHSIEATLRALDELDWMPNE